MKLYQVSGLGANEKVFKNLSLPKDIEQVFIPWLQPEFNETLPHYVERMVESINPKEDFLLMGLSFGGIIVQEINNLIKPKHTFIISSVKNRMEMPPLFKFSAKTNLHKLIPMSFLTSDKVFSYMMLRKIYIKKNSKFNLEEVFQYRDHYFLKWSINKIVNWDNLNIINNYTHIHGDKDIVFPIKYINNCEVISGGTHAMIMQKPKQINKILCDVIEKL